MWGKEGGENMKEVEKDYCNLCLEVNKTGEPTGGLFCKDFSSGRMVFRKLQEPESPRQFWASQRTGTIADCGKWQEAQKR